MYKLQKTSNCKSRDRIGIILVNLGTPSGLDYWSIRRYLAEFLSDQRVVEVNKIWWQFLLQTIILTFRPFKTGKAYEQIWNKTLNESPLLTITRSQAKKLQNAFGKDSDSIVVDFAMRYGDPSIRHVMRKIQQAGCGRVLIVPLYPQYSASTTATVNDCVSDTLKKMRWQPTLRTLPPYYAEDMYISALCTSLKKGVQSINFTPKKIIATYHGIPVRYHKGGDPYPCMCRRTTRAIREHKIFKGLGFSDDILETTFQSLFGREEWVKPYTEPTLVQYAKDGIDEVVIIAPGFASDCLETLEEIEGQIREAFIGAGGKNFAYIPCLNDSKESIELLKYLSIQQLQGWI